MATVKKIVPCLWFDNQGEEAARYYTGIFKNSKILDVTHYGEAGYEQHKQKAGTVMTVSFELEGERFLALNGGPVFKFNEAVSLMVMCKDQEEVDYYWSKLGAGGDEKAQQCGWLKDKFGVSWQVTPTMLLELWKNEKSPNAQKAFVAMMKMKKIDIATIKAAYDS